MIPKIDPSRLASEIREAMQIEDRLERAIALSQIRKIYKISQGEFYGIAAIARLEVGR